MVQDFKELARLFGGVVASSSEDIGSLGLLPLNVLVPVDDAPAVPLGAVEIRIQEVALLRVETTEGSALHLIIFLERA